MASTQNLTELPVIQQTGMDYSTVIQQIKEIIESNNNWASNWTQFYNSEAGTMLIQLMAWICDNLSIRQDLLYNESFLSTATSLQAKRRLLKQIGYNLKSPSFAVVPITLEFKNIVTGTIDLSNVRKDETKFTEIKSKIFKFYAPDVNGKSTGYEIMMLDADGTPNYTYAIKLKGGSITYDRDADGNQLLALQGNTTYIEHTSDTQNGPIFVLDETDIDINTIKVYDITDNNRLHKRVDNFMDTDVADGASPCYIIEQNEQGYYQIRYPTIDLLTYNNNSLEDRLYKAGNTIGIFYRTTKGADGNVPANYFGTSEVIYDSDGDAHEVTITNHLAGSRGKDGETLANAVKNAPLSLVAMNRAVTSEDFDRILNRYNLVAKCRSFTPDNMPDDFERYFGRKISPEEIFSFLVLNKNFNGIPNTKLNYFPWVETIKSNILNEKYVFGNAVMNSPTEYNPAWRNFYIKDDFAIDRDNYNPDYDDGRFYFKGYDVVKTNPQTTVQTHIKARQLENCLYIKTSGLFKDTLIKEKNSNKSRLKIQLHPNYSTELFISRIINMIGNTVLLTSKNNLVEDNLSATYISLNTKDFIDCKLYRYIKFVFDDTFVVTVDLHKEAKYLYPAYHDVVDEVWEDLGPSDNASNTDPRYMEYYKNYWLLVDNEPTSTSDAYNQQMILKYNGETRDYYKEMYSYHNSKEYAYYRKGIVQLMREALERVVNYTEEIDYNDLPQKLEDLRLEIIATGQYFNKTSLVKRIIAVGTLVKKINEFTSVFRLGEAKKDYEYYVVQYQESKVKDDTGTYVTVVDFAKVLKTIENTTILGLPDEINATEELTRIEFTKQKLMYNSVFANNTSSFVDLGIQDEYPEDAKYLYSSYELTEQSQAKYYAIDEKKNFYRIRVNDRIFAVRLDAYTAITAYNFYVRLSLNNDATINPDGSFDYVINDYFPYFGKGDMKYGVIDSRTIKYANGKEMKYKYKNFNFDPEYDTNIAAELELYYDDPFSREKIASSEAYINPNKVIQYDTTREVESDIDNVKEIRYNLNILATTLEYLFSCLNDDVNTIFEFKDGKWYDLKTKDDNEIRRYYGKELEDELTKEEKLAYRNVLDGKLRIRKVLKSNYDVNNVVRIEEQNTNVYISGYEYDIRFEYLNGEKEDLTISSVSEAEVFGGNNDPEMLFGKEPEDLIEKLCGRKNRITGSSVDYVNNIENSILVSGDLDRGYTLALSSQKKGMQSSLYFIQTSDSEGTELISEFGLIDGFLSDYSFISGKSYFNKRKTAKAFGRRRVELFLGDDNNRDEYICSVGVPNDDLKSVRGALNGNLRTKIAIGDILGTSNDLNYTDFRTLFLSYTFNDADNLRLNKYDNFYYSNNVASNEKAKPPFIGIEGEVVFYDSKDEYYYINEEESDFGVKITKEPVDTNSYYAINSDSYEELGVLKNDRTKIETNIISAYDVTDEGLTKYNGVAYGVDTTTYTPEQLKAAATIEFPLIMSIDKMSDDGPMEGREFVYKDYRDSVMAINAGYLNKLSGQRILNELQLVGRNHGLEFINKNYFSLFRKYYNTNNKLIFEGMYRTDASNITFYYPDITAYTNQAADLNISSYDSKTFTEDRIMLSVKLFYKMFFGTNITNPEFYALYPPEEMKELNSSNIIVSLNDKTGEYFYCPMPKHHLKFIYRGFVDAYKQKSKYGDYYVSVENNGEGFNGGYRFYLNKTEHNDFPDKEFYVHFVNDRTYEPKRNTEEDTIRQFMKKYQIIGTEMHILQPYFKTFDISGKINYNANYDISTIRKRVNEKLTEAYSLNSIADIEMGNTVYRSDIYRILVNIEGVQSVEIDYFGYDVTDKEKYPDQKYSLNTSSDGNNKSGGKFYITSVLAESDGRHGINFEYSKTGVTLG